jgi:hypothetical protein
MDPAIRRVIEVIHASPYRCVVAVTGGGTQAAGLLLNVPGGSRTILEVVVPYHEQALIEFLGQQPPSFCSVQTSVMLAQRALARARWLDPGANVIGLGCTASLASDRPKRGEHRLHVATHSELGSTHFSLTLTKGARDREAEEAVVDAVVLNALAAACGIAERIELPLLPGEHLPPQEVIADHPVARLLRGDQASLCVRVDGRMRADAERPAVLLPGSFNPIHAGHWQLADVAARQTGGSLAFELSVVNVDKPSLGADEIRRRLAQFAWRADVWLTRAPTFAEKAELFPGAIFVVGADTALRLVHPKYYGDSEPGLMAALAGIRASGCRFLVAGRVDDSNRFMELDQLAIPPDYCDLFTPIPARVFRADLSSTLMRQAACGTPVAGADAVE